jgi:hypothetical protein
MSDRHLRILRQLAQQRRRVLRDHDAVDHLGDTGSAVLRQRLTRAVKRTEAQVTGAEARRTVRRPGRQR